MLPDDRLEIRHARRGDCGALLEQMQALALFEGYADRFCVTRAALEDRLFDRRDFDVLVAERSGLLIGLLVYCALPFTYDLKPWLYMKELHVSEQSRSLGVGRMLMESLIAAGCKRGVSRIRWDVLTRNQHAQRFYRSMGAAAEDDWQLFGLDLAIGL